MTETQLLHCRSLLASKGLRIAFIESASAGALSTAFALTPDSGSHLLGGLVCYDVEEKISLLHIPRSLITAHTAESEAVTRAMCLQGAQLFPRADVVVAVTGLLKSGGSEHAEKPVGTFFIALHLECNLHHYGVPLTGTPHHMLEQLTQEVAALIMRYYPPLRSDIH